MKKNYFYFIATLFFIALACIPCSSSYAQENISEETIAITLQTSSERIELKKGEKISRTVRVRNTGKKAYDFTVEAVPYQPDEQYRNNFEIENKWTQISRWIKFDKTQYHAEAGEIVEVPFRIEVPNEGQAAAGGQYAAIAVTVRDDAVGGINIVKRAAYQIFGLVDGAIVNSGSVTYQNVPRYIPKAPLKTQFAVQNSGNTDFYAYGKLKVSSIFGRTVFETKESERTSVFAFPESTPPEAEATWQNARIGLYWVAQEVELLGNVTTTKRLTLIAPLWLIIVVAFGLIALIYLIISSIRRKRVNQPVNQVV